MKIQIEKKKRIIFSLIIGLITTSIISFTLIVVNVGFTATFLVIWIKSWIVAYVVVIPVLLLIAPPIQKSIDNYFDSKSI